MKTREVNIEEDSKWSRIAYLLICFVSRARVEENAGILDCSFQKEYKHKLVK